jgi:hypothetical protein
MTYPEDLFTDLATDADAIGAGTDDGSPRTVPAGSGPMPWRTRSADVRPASVCWYSIPEGARQ